MNTYRFQIVMIVTVALLWLVKTGEAAFLSPQSATASSTYPSARFSPNNAIDGSGFWGNQGLHRYGIDRTTSTYENFWHSANGDLNDGNAWLQMDLGTNVTLTCMYLWNNNRSGNMPRSISNFTVEVSADGVAWDTALTNGTARIAPNWGNSWIKPQVFPLTNAANVSHARLQIHSVHGSPSETIVQLSEVAFEYEAEYNAQPIAATATSINNLENNTPNAMISGSGLTLGKHAQHDGYYQWWSGNDRVIDDQELVFTLDGLYDLSDAYIWNMNTTTNVTGRGVEQFDMWVSADGYDWTEVLTNATLTAGGFTSAEPPQIKSLTGADNVRFVKMGIDTCQDGAVTGDVGLAEIAFKGTRLSESTLNIEYQLSHDSRQPLQPCATGDLAETRAIVSYSSAGELTTSDALINGTYNDDRIWFGSVGGYNYGFGTAANSVNFGFLLPVSISEIAVYTHNPSDNRRHLNFDVAYATDAAGTNWQYLAIGLHDSWHGGSHYSRAGLFAHNGEHMMTNVTALRLDFRPTQYGTSVAEIDIIGSPISSATEIVTPLRAGANQNPFRFSSIAEGSINGEGMSGLLMGNPYTDELYMALTADYGLTAEHEYYYELPSRYNLTQAHIWPCVGAWSAHGIQQFDILVSSDGRTWRTALDNATLSQGADSAPYEQPHESFVLTGASDARFVKLDVDSKYGGTGQHAGLSEIRFEGTQTAVEAPPMVTTAFSGDWTGITSGVSDILTGIIATSDENLSSSGAVLLTDGDLAGGTFGQSDKSPLELTFELDGPYDITNITLYVGWGDDRRNIDCNIWYSDNFGNSYKLGVPGVNNYRRGANYTQIEVTQPDGSALLQHATHLRFQCHSGWRGNWHKPVIWEIDAYGTDATRGLIMMIR